jgi:hypothetical protein
MNAIEFSKSLFCAMDKSATGEIGYANHSDISVLSAPSTDGETLLTTIGHPVAGGSVQVSVRSKPHNNFTENLVSLVIHTHAKYAEYLNAYYATGHHDKVYFRSTLDQQLIDLELSNNNGNPVDEDAILDELCGDDCTEEERNELRDSLNEVARCIEELKEMEDTEDEG